MAAVLGPDEQSLRLCFPSRSFYDDGLPVIVKQPLGVFL
jgi:hypothetical protein